MAERENQKLRIIYILNILKKYSDEETPLNSSDIINHLADYGISVERKTVYDDIATLEQGGYDIIKSTKPKGWFLGDREFEIPEIYLLSDAVRAANFISAKKTRELLSKLNSMLSLNQQRQRKNAVYFSADSKTENEELYYNIDKINRAILERVQIEFVYSQRILSENREIVRANKRMIVNPYALTWQDDHYYLIANHNKYDNLIHLRLDRISKLELLETKARHFCEVSEYKDFFDTADYTDKLFGMHGGELVQIEFSCNKRIFEQVLDRFSESIYIKNVTGDHFGFTVDAALSQALVTWIINYGSDLKVKKPQALIEMVKTRANQILNNYTVGD